MNSRKPFETATPEEMGVSSSLILEYIDNLYNFDHLLK